RVESVKLEGLDEAALVKMSQKNLWALSAAEMRAVQGYFSDPGRQVKRQELGLSDPTDVEIEIIAQSWSEHCKHKIFNAHIHNQDRSGGQTTTTSIPSEVDSLFKATISGTTAEIQKPWLLSVFEDNAGI